MLLVGDDIISTDDPVRVLVVASPERMLLIEEAVVGRGIFFRVDAYHDLQSGLEEARSGVHDAVLLTLQLPDAVASGCLRPLASGDRGPPDPGHR